MFLVIFLDLSKAFDMANHEKLQEKLEKSRINGNFFFFFETLL